MELPIKENLKSLIDSRSDLTCQLSEIDSRLFHNSTNIENVLEVFLKKLVDSELLNTVFITKDETVPELCYRGQLKPHRRWSRNESACPIMYLYYDDKREGDYTSIEVVIRGYSLEFNYYNTNNSRDNCTFLIIPIEIIDDMDAIKKLIEDEFEVKYQALQEAKEKKKQERIKVLERELKTLNSK